MHEYRQAVAAAASEACEVGYFSALCCVLRLQAHHVPILRFRPQAVGLGHVDRALRLWEGRLAHSTADAAFVPSLTPIGTLSPTPTWEPHDPSRVMKLPSRNTPLPSGPPRSGLPTGFEPLSGVYL